MREWLAKRLFEAGNRAMKRSDDTRGIAWYYAALACVPYSPTPLVNLGAAMAREGDYYGALGCVRRAMLMSPNDPLPHWNAALYHLTLGQFDEGWRLYEARFAMPRFSEINGLRGGDMAKMWTHDTYPGKRVLVFNEQGAGDTIMGLRYGPTLKREYGVQRLSLIHISEPTRLL